VKEPKFGGAYAKLSCGFYRKSEGNGAMDAAPGGRASGTPSQGHGRLAAMDEGTRKKRGRDGRPAGKNKKFDSSGISDFRNELCAYVVVQAESHESAARMFLNHQHFTLFPGDSVEILECLPVPQN
jgi:hypothetical protein